MAAFEEGARLGPEAAAPRIAPTLLKLRGLFRTSTPVVALPVPGAMLREIALRATIDQRALVLVSGPEGEALADSAEALGKEVIRVMVHPGQVLEPVQLLRFLSGPPVDTFALVHAESGTGALAPLAELARVARAKRGVLIFVDAAATIGAAQVETAEWGLDVVLAPSEGPLGLPPGLAFAALSSRFVERARTLTGRGLQLDPAVHQVAAAQGKILLPIAPPLAVALDRQLERILEQEGLPRRWARHERMRQMVEAWVRGQRGLTLVTDGDHKAPSLTCLALPESLSAKAAVLALASEGFRVAPGLGRDADRYLRIGHMGDLEPSHLAELLAVLGRVLGGRRPIAP